MDNLQQPEEVQNSATAIADMMAKFMSPAQSTEAEILAVVAEYSLQIRPDQHKVLNRLQMLIFKDTLNDNAKKAILEFVPMYKNLKRYHDTLPFIGRAIEAMSLKKFIEAKSIQGQIMNVK